MAQDINLLPEQTEDQSKVKQNKLITQISVVVLAVTIVAVVGLFAAKLALQAQLNSLGQQIATQENRIQAKKNEEGVVRTIDAKLTTLSTFFASQKHYSNFLNQFTKTLPTTMTLTDLSVDTKNQATIAGKVSTYSDLAGFFDKLRTASASDNSSTPYFAKPTLTSISRDDSSGQIKFTVTFTLSPQVLAAGATS
jgi:Tfp pilus assembly protein PilN